MTNLNERKINNEDFPRKGSVMYNFHNKNEDSRRKTLKKWRKINKYLIIPLYRLGLLRLLGFGKIFLILTSKGWKTGKKRRTPLEYRRYEEVITIFSARGEDSTWVKNIRANPDQVFVTKGFRHFKVGIEIISDIEQKKDIMKWYVTKFKKSAKALFGWNPKQDSLDTFDFSKLINLISIFKIYKEENKF